MARKKEATPKEETPKKAQYKAVRAFTDSQDNDEVYQIGDVFPNPVSKVVSQKRLAELLSSGNAIGKPVIKEI